MSRDIAMTIARNRLNELRTRSFAELSQLTGSTLAEEVKGPDGKDYQIEVDFIWDNPKEKKSILVLASVDGGGVSSLRPALASFAMGADGSFLAGAPTA